EAVEALGGAGGQARYVGRDETGVGIRRRRRCGVAHFARARPPLVEEPVLEVLLFLVGPLAAVRAEDLDAVVLVRIVRCRDRDAGARAELEDELRDAGSGDDAGRRDVATAVREAGGEVRDDAGRGLARIPPEDDPRRPARRQTPAELAAEQPHRGRIERELAGLAAKAVRSEKLHGFPFRALAGADFAVGSGGGAGLIFTRTVTNCPSRTRSPGAGRSRVVDSVKEASRPSSDTGWVDRAVSPPRVLAGPRRRAFRGSTATSSRRAPGAGCPESWAAIGRVFST